MTQLRTGDTALDNGHLASFVERLERLTEEKKAVADDFKDVMAEAKSSGLDPKIVRKVLAIRKQDREKRLEEEALLEIYLAVLGIS